MKRRRFNLDLKIVIFPLIILLAFYFIIGYIWKVLVTSEFFTVKKIIVRNSELSFDYLKGSNIFTLDLNAQSRNILLNCPDCRLIRFARFLPNCLFVDFIKRKPVALIKLYKSFAVDEQGVLFYPGSPIEQLDLPIIYGIGADGFVQKPGVKYRNPQLSLALSIIKEFKINKVFKDFSLKRVDVAGLESAGFFMLLPRSSQGEVWHGLEVRIGENNIRQKMMILGGLVMQARKDWGNIKYIDLRFKEPLIKLNKNL